MGQAIVYCAVCNAQLRDADFARGTAFKIEHKIFCRNCVPPDHLPAPPARPAPTKRSSVTTSSGLPAATPDPPRSGSALILVGGIATGILVVLIGFVMFSSDSARQAPPSAPPPPEARRPEPAPSAVSPAEIAASEALARLLRQIEETPADLDRQQTLLEDLARRAASTSVEPEVDRQFVRMAQRRKERRAAELAQLERQAQSSPEDQAAILLRAARQRYSDRSWAEAVDRLLATLGSKSTEPERVPAAAPPPRAIPAPTPAAKPPPAFPDGWETAMALATGRDYAAAQAALEKSPDLPLVRAAAALHRDSIQALQKTPRGQRVSLGTVEGSFLRENGGIVELKTDAGVVAIETGEIAPTALVALARASGPVDPKAAAILCLIEGDPAGARSLIGADATGLPDRFWAYADKVARAPTDPAREVYQAALTLLSTPATAADGVMRLQGLLRDRPDDPFVRRNRPAILTRSQAGREFLILAEDFRASGLFRSAHGSKLEACWTCEADVEPAKQKDTFLDLEFSTVADTAYKAWALVGGCCQEVFDFSCQGSEMEAGRATKEPAEPGSGVAVTVKPYVPNVKKTHAQHNGPKQASRWEWAALPVPRYAKPGVQRIRILSDQKGFSVAAVVVSASRSGPPTESELRELSRARGERPKAAAPQPKAIPMLTCAMDGTERHPVGELRDRSLHGIPLFGSCYTGVERNQSLVFPEHGEVRLTYFLKTPSNLVVRIRVEKDGATLPFDAPIPSPVVGTPTEIRIPFANFQQAHVTHGPHLVPGDTARMFYVFGSVLECGLRLDAFSLVEIGK